MRTSDKRGDGGPMSPHASAATAVKSSFYLVTRLSQIANNNVEEILK